METAPKSSVTLEEIDRCLPQTQCTMCGYPRCLDYASAILDGRSEIDRCPPGGTTTLLKLGNLMNKSIRSLADDCESYTGRKVAKIKEEACIGCTLCIAPCPLDAIVGTAKHMHTVIENDCSGCGLCVEHCPVDCIWMIDSEVEGGNHFWKDFRDDEVSRWRSLAQRHCDRVECGDQLTIDSEQYSDLKLQIRDAVNRERSRRWKRTNKNAARLQSTGIAK